MSPSVWMAWWPLVALGDTIGRAATTAAVVVAAAGLVALCVRLCGHLLGPRRRTALRGWILWRWHRGTARRFAHSVATGDAETAEAHARHLLASTPPRRAA